MQCDDDYSMRQNKRPAVFFSSPSHIIQPQSICNQCHKCNNRMRGKPPPIDDPPPPQIGRNERYKITFSQEHATKSGCSQSKILSARVYLREGRKTFLGAFAAGAKMQRKQASFMKRRQKTQPLSIWRGFIFHFSRGAIHILRRTSRGPTVIKRPTEGKERVARA